MVHVWPAANAQAVLTTYVVLGIRSPVKGWLLLFRICLTASYAAVNSSASSWLCSMSGCYEAVQSVMICALLDCSGNYQVTGYESCDEIYAAWLGSVTLPRCSNIKLQEISFAFMCIRQIDCPIKPQ